MANNVQMVKELQRIGLEYSKFFDPSNFKSDTNSLTSQNPKLFNLLSTLEEVLYLVFINNISTTDDQELIQRGHRFMKELLFVMMKFDFWQAFWLEIDQEIKRGGSYKDYQMFVVSKFSLNFLHHVFMDTPILETLHQKAEKNQILRLLINMIQIYIDQMHLSPRFYPKNLIKIMRIQDKALAISKKILSRNDPNVKMLEEIGTIA